MSFIYIQALLWPKFKDFNKLWNRILAKTFPKNTHPLYFICKMYGKYILYIFPITVTSFWLGNGSLIKRPLQLILLNANYLIWDIFLNKFKLVEKTRILKKIPLKSCFYEKILKLLWSILYSWTKLTFQCVHCLEKGYSKKKMQGLHGTWMLVS